MSHNEGSEDPSDPGAQTSNTEAADQDYKVGYRRPPLNGRFKPGRSGNPRGRVKGSRNARSVVLQAANRPVRVRTNGKVRKVTTLEAMVENAALKAAQGDPKALAAFIGLMLRTGALNEPDDDISATSLPEEDEAIIKDYMRRYSRGASEVENG